MKTAALLCVALTLLPAGAGASPEEEDSLRGELFGCPGAAWPWTGEGPFVNVPAGLAAAPGGLVGGALALAFAPADLIDQAAGNKQNDAPIPRFAHAGLCAGVYLGKGLALAVGAPFWLLKRAFWDWPRRAVSKNKLEHT